MSRSKCSRCPCSIQARRSSSLRSLQRLRCACIISFTALSAALLSQLDALCCGCFIFSPQILLMQYQSVYVFMCACSQLLLTYASAIAQIMSVMSKASVLFAVDELVDGGASLPKDAFIVRFRTDAKHSRLTFLSAITDPEERVIQLEAE